MNLMRHQQRGATLLISLIMLVMMTLLAVTSFNLGKGSLQSVGNMQQRNEALAAAQETMEQIISSASFATSNTIITAANSSCPNGGIVNTKCIDTNGDGNADVTVTVATPTCVKAAVIPNDQLDEANVDCSNSTSPLQYSFCSNTLWEVSVTAVDATTQAQYSITQGIAMPARTEEIAQKCP